MYRSRTCVVRGNEAVVTSTAQGMPSIAQTFVLDGGNKFLARVTVTGSDLATNWISPVVMDTPGGVDVGSHGDLRVLQVPFDNDAWVSYDARPIAGGGTSYEVAAIYDNLNRNGFANQGVVYVNLDSYWDNLSSAQLDAFVAHCHANGQRAGIYWTPFVDWGKSTTRQVEGTSYVYGDVWLRNAKGDPIEVDHAYA